MDIFYYSLLVIIVLIGLAVGFQSVSNLIAIMRTKGVPYVPLSRKQLQHIRKAIMLPADARVVDVGCGDGRVMRLFEAMGVRSVSGYEINWWAVLMARLHNWRKQSKVHVYSTDFTKVDLSQYSVVFCYLLPHYLQGLREQFDLQLQAGTLVISYAFDFKDWHDPVEVLPLDINEPEKNRIFIYKIL